MREIIFRGKRVDNGEWIEGSLWIYCGVYKILTPGNVVGWDVYPESVSQYIGKVDKNGKKIFGGDLLDGFQYPFYHEARSEHNYFAEVVWFDDNCAFGLYTHKHPTSSVSGISDGNADYIEGFDPEDWVVIGNIHDNPELLGGNLR